MHAFILDLRKFLAVFAPLLSVASGLPQLARAARRSSDGVSLTTWVLLVALAELWFVYGLFASVLAEIVTNTLTGGISVLVVVLVARERGQLRVQLVRTGAVTIGVVGFALLCLVAHRPSVEAALAVSCSLGIFAPQCWTALRRHEMTGVSPATWLLAFLAALSWGAYGLLLHRLPVYLPSVAMVPMSLVIMLRALVRRPVLRAQTVS